MIEWSPDATRSAVPILVATGPSDSASATYLQAAAYAGLMGLLMVGAGLLVRSVSRRAADGRMDRNPAAGIRTSATTASKEAWLLAHQVGQRPSLLGGTAGVVGGVALSVLGILTLVRLVEPNPTMAAATALILLTATAMLVGVIVGAVRGHRAAADLNRRSAEPGGPDSY